ncbi:MAG: tetratricopeptide repeat protein [Bacteroidia bacterium]
MTTTHIPAYHSLSETEQKKIQKQFHESDLDYLASYAIESGSITDADIEDLYAKIDQRASGGTPAWLNGLMLLLCGMLIGGSVFFVIFQGQQTHASHYEAIAASAPAELKTQAPVLSDNLPAAAEKAGYSEEHFSIHHPAEETSAQKETYSELESKDLSTIDLSAAETSSPALIDLENIPNAPVIYISDLKVANYKPYYFKNNQSFVPDNSGLSAEFADHSTSADADKSVLAEKKYYAHEIIRDAMAAFHKKNYAESITLLRLLYDHNKNDVNTRFYLGMSYYYLGNTSAAIRYFDETLASDVNVFAQEAEFYKAMALNDSGNAEEAAQLLKTISAKHSFYSGRADELLKSVKER